jgi:hypothetical protein
MSKDREAQKLASQVVGNVGMYFAAYQLSLRGWNVMPTSRNARGIDLLAYDAIARNFLGIQIKTLSKKNGAVPLGLHTPDNLMGDWWIIVTNIARIADGENPICFVMTPDEVRKGVVRDKGGQQAYWLPWTYYSKPDFSNWDRIGRGT